MDASEPIVISAARLWRAKLSELLLALAGLMLGSAALLCFGSQRVQAQQSGVFAAPEPRSAAGQARVQIPEPPALPSGVPSHFETDQNKVAAELGSFIREALENNPTLSAARANLEVYQAKVPQAGMPDDPLLGYEMKDLPTTFSFTTESGTQKQIIAQQKYPFPGKLGLRETIAGKQAEMTSEQMRAVIVELITEVRSVFTDIFKVDKETELALEHERMLRGLADVATDKYRVGPGLQQDILNAYVALSRLGSTLVELASNRQSQLLRLTALLNRDSVQVAPLGALPRGELTHTPLELEQIAQATSPAIRERERAVARDESQVKLAERAALPDFALEFIYGSRNDGPGKTPTVRPDLWTAQILINVPVFYFSKQRQALIEARAQLKRSRQRLAAVREETIMRLRDSLYRLRQHRQIADAFQKQIIPLARTELAASMSAYRVNQVDFLTVLASQDTLENYETEYWRNRAEAFRDIAKIEELSGVALLEGGWGQ